MEVFYLTWVTWNREQIISDGVFFFFFLPQKWFEISEEFFKTHISVGWYGSFFSSFLVVGDWNCYLISGRDCDAYFDRCRVTEWPELKQKPKKLVPIAINWSRTLSQILLFLYFPILWWSPPLACWPNELNDWLILKYSRTRIRMKVSMGWWFSRLMVKIVFILWLTVNFFALQVKFAFLRSFFKRFMVRLCHYLPFTTKCYWPYRDP